MDFEPLNPEPIDPLVIDAASGSAGERKGMSRWTPKWGGRFSRQDVIVLGVIASVVVAVVALLLL